MKIAVLGAGAWGTALAAHLGERHDTVLWARDPALVEALAREHRNRAYLPDAILPDSIRYESHLPTAIRHACGDDALVVVATPVAGLRDSCVAMRELACVPVNLIWLCKGFERDTRLLPHQVVAAVLAPTRTRAHSPGRVLRARSRRTCRLR